MKLEDISIHAFILKHGIKNEKGDPIEFKNHPFQFHIYSDESKFLAVLKAAQVGLSTCEIIKQFYLCAKRKLDMIYCVDLDTEVLSERGFLRGDQLKEGEKILTLGLDGITRWSEVEEIFLKEVETEMYRHKTRNFDAFTTSNHRWLTKGPGDGFNFTESSELHKSHRYIPKTISNNPTIKSNYSDEYVKLLAWVFAEGNYCKQTKGSGKKSYSIIITQSERVKKIRGDYPLKIPTAQFAKSLTKRQCQIFIEEFVKADGWVDGSGTMAISQKNPNCIDILTMIAVLGGYAPSVLPPGKNCVYTLRMTQFKSVYTSELKSIVSRERLKVWCPRTKEGTFYARRGGRCYWTGNTLPTDTDVRDFVGGKVNRIINQNQIFQQLTSDKDSIEMKRIGDSTIYYRGTYTARKAIMVTADLLVHDEIDSSDQKVVEEYQARLQHSKYKGRHVFSHPSVPGHGVDKYWQQSDQKHWFVKCPHCKKEHFMDWPGSVDMKAKVFVCKYCHGALSDRDRKKGRWVAKYRNRKYSGYWVPQLICPWVTAGEIVDRFNDRSTTIEFFWNKVLGLPYEGEGNIVTPDMILRNITDKVNKQERVIIGADSGLIKHYVIGNSEGLFYYGKTERWEDIEKLMLRLNAVLVLDALPDLTAPRMLQAKYPGKVYLMSYGADRKTQQLIRWGKNKEKGSVLVDRNRMIQLVIDEFKNRLCAIQGRPADWADYIEHFQNIYRIKEMDKHDRPVFTWAKKNTEDHWCFDGETLIKTRDEGDIKIKNIRNGMYVHTSDSCYEVQKAWKTKENAIVYNAYFSDGSRLILTKNHKIKTYKGDIAINSIVNNDKIKTWKQLFLKASNLSDTQIQIKGLKELIMLHRDHKSKRGFADYIRKYGKINMVRFQRVFVYIIKTMILSIMRLIIWNLSSAVNIKAFIAKRNLKTKNITKDNANILKKSDRSLMNGEKPRMEKNGTEYMLLIRWYWINQKSLDVLSAILHQLQGADKVGNSVQEDVSLVGIHENAERKDVYNLTVKEKHEFFANGILVSNCHATVGWRVGMDGFGMAEGGTATGEKIPITAQKGVEIDIEGQAPMPELKELFDYPENKIDDWRHIG